MESTALASGNAFSFLHRVLFGCLSEGSLCGTGLGYAEQEAEASDSSDLDGCRVDASVVNPGVTVLVLHPGEDPSD